MANIVNSRALVTTRVQRTRPFRFASGVLRKSALHLMAEQQRASMEEYVCFQAEKNGIGRLAWYR
jgi:hypothetical protein